MVGFVIVSHSEKLAESVVELAKLMAKDVPMASAGGLLDGSFGTSFEKIQSAIESVYSEDGVIVLMDMGSAVMTTEMVIESMNDKKIKMVDAPLIEGAIAGSMDSFIGQSIDEIAANLKVEATECKF